MNDAAEQHPQQSPDQQPDEAPGTEVARAFAAVEVARAAAEDAISAAATASTDLTVATSDAASVKSQAAAVFARATKARADLAAAQETARQAVHAQQRDLEARLREQMALLAPLEEQIRQAKEIIWTVNLYLGRDEEIHALTQGAPAAAEEPLVVRQQVLAMDEETGANAASGGSDVRNIDDFDEWITTDPSHLHQVLPETRGVVAIMPRRKERDYGNPWTNEMMRDLNHQTWWLIRNGENLYRMITDFHVGERLVPLRDEFTALFTDPTTGQRLTPGSKAWITAETRAGARERHFMRIALILQGLVDRTTVFAPLPAGGLNLLAPEHYDTGRVVLLADDEHTLTTGRAPFYTWLAAKNSLLSPGHRVLVATRHSDFPQRSTKSWRHPRIHPARAADLPDPHEAHTITRKGAQAGSLVFSYERTEDVYDPRTGRYRAPQAGATFTILAGDKFVLPVDLVTIAEMREYLDARTERHAYVDMFPTLRAAIAFKEAEAAAEAPFRDLLAARIAETEDLDLPVAQAAVEEEVTRWKVGNRWHRPLVTEPEVEARAAAAILAERARRVRADQRSARAGLSDADAVSRLRARHPQALVIARRKSGPYLVVEPQPRRYARPTNKEQNYWGDQVAPLDVYTRVHEYTPRALTSGADASVKEWVIPTPAQVTRWVILFEGQGWARWNKRARAAEHLTDPEIDAVVAAARAEQPPAGFDLLAVAYRERVDWANDAPTFTLWFQPHEGAVGEEGLLTGPDRWLYSSRRMLTWTRTKDGSVTTQQSERLHTDNTTTWDVQHNTILQGKTLGTIRPPWAGDRRANDLLWVDADVLARGQQQADAWNRHRQQRAYAYDEVRRLVTSVEQAWLERAVQAAKARFIEDYGDESLWEAHHTTLAIEVPFGRRSAKTPKDYQGTSAALVNLVSRLVEQGRAPYGLTVAQAVTLLAETLVEPPGHSHRGSRGGAEVDIAEDVRSLRFAEERPTLDAG